MLDFGFYNMDCMEGMKEFPDKYFDLAIVDPPYGDGGVLDERNEIRTTVRQIPRTGFRGKTYPGGGPEKFGKKLLRGMLRLERTTSKSFSASHAIR